MQFGKIREWKKLKKDESHFVISFSLIETELRH